MNIYQDNQDYSTSDYTYRNHGHSGETLKSNSFQRFTRNFKN